MLLVPVIIALAMGAVLYVLVDTWSEYVRYRVPTPDQHRCTQLSRIAGGRAPGPTHRYRVIMLDQHNWTTKGEAILDQRAAGGLPPIERVSI